MTADLLSVHVMFKYMNACDRYFLETGAFKLMKSWKEWIMDKTYKLKFNFCVCSDISELSFFSRNE